MDRASLDFCENYFLETMLFFKHILLNNEAEPAGQWGIFSYGPYMLPLRRSVRRRCWLIRRRLA